MVGTVQLQAGIVKLYLGTVNVQLGTRCNGIGLYWAKKVAKLDTGRVGAVMVGILQL